MYGHKTGGSGYGNKSVRSFQASRSKRSQSMDSQRRAPIAKTSKQWLNDPSHYDLKNVDTPIKAKSSKALTGLERILKLQAKKDELLEYSRQIQSVSAMGQAPPVYFSTLDKGVKLGEEQAKIWNEIRSYTTKDGYTTLWQLADKKYPVHSFGKEKMLNLSKEQIEDLKKALPN